MRILFLTHRLPYAPNRGDRIRAFHLLREMQRWADVDLVSLVHDREEASHADELRTVVASVRTASVHRLANLGRTLVALPGRRPATHTLLHAPSLAGHVAAAAREHAPDVVFAFCTGVAPGALTAPVRHTPLALDMVDVDSAKWAALARTTGGPRSWMYAREARLLSAFEREITTRASTTLVTTAAEAATLTEIAPGARVEVVQNGIDVEVFRPSIDPVESKTVVFCGVMDYAPNTAGALWLGRHVWPIVLGQIPDALLHIVGANPTRDVRTLAQPGTGITVTGAVPDVRPFLWNAAVAAAPLQTARGVQNKVLEAVAAGLPVVVTPAVSVGLPEEIRAACDIANDAASFAAALVAGLRDRPASRRQRARLADVAALAWPLRLAGLRTIVERAAAG